MHEMESERQDGIGHLIRQRRISLSLSGEQLAEASGISPSHVTRIERGERFPSGRVLNKLAKPLHFEEDELMALAGYLKEKPTVCEDRLATSYHLDPLVRNLLSQETVEMQRLVWAVLEVMKVLARDLSG